MFRPLQISAVIAGVLLAGVTATGAGQRYSNSFSCIPSSCPAGRSTLAANKRVKSPAKRMIPGAGNLKGTQKPYSAGHLYLKKQDIAGETPDSKNARKRSTSRREGVR